MRAVGLLKPNDFGLFDMHGNVRDWCQEPYHVLEETLAAANQVREDTEDTSALREDVQRVIRGGAYWDSSAALTSISRSQFWPRSSGGGVGFRIARTHK